MGKWLTNAGRRAIKREIKRINSSFTTAQRIGAVKALNRVLNEGAPKKKVKRKKGKRSKQAIALILVLAVIPSVWLIYNKSLRYGSIYDYNGFEKETHLLKFEMGYNEILLGNIIFPSSVSNEMKQLLSEYRFVEVWDYKSDDVGILALHENLNFDFSSVEQAEYVALISAEKVAVVKITFMYKTETGEFAERHCIWVNRIESLHKASWWE